MVNSGNWRLMKYRVLFFSLLLATNLLFANNIRGERLSVTSSNALVYNTADNVRLKVADPLQDNMVIQQNKPLKVWGKAASGETVVIDADWLAHPATVVADSGDNFMGIIEVPMAKPGDYTRHTITIQDKDTLIRLKNILIGDVWFCSGQSNMQFPMKEVINAKKEIASANYPHIRLLNVALNFSDQPIRTMKGKWRPCTPRSVKGFSAVSYYFGRRLHNKLDIPIGLIFSGIGASAAQAYVSKKVLAEDPLLDSVYLQPYLRSKKSKEKITSTFTFEKVTRPYLLYNALINPFVHLSVKGFCWYQGASNRKERSSYVKLMYALIKSWRTAFSQGALPFYYVQVAPFFYDNTDPTLAGYAFFREAQERISRLNNTAMVVTMDVGAAKNLHPPNKKPVGIRLARAALNRTYGFLDIAYRGPHFQSVRFVRDTAIIAFAQETIQGGLQTDDGHAPRYFFLAGKDSIFHQARASIHGDKIYVTCPDVLKPIAVRYAFTNFPVTHLKNGEGLPAVPFRTDHWKENKIK